MKIRTKVFALVLCFLAALVLVVGCGKKEDQTAGTSPSPSRTKAASAKKCKIAGIVFQEDQFFRLIENGMKSAAGRLSVDLSLENSNNLVDKESSLVDTYVGKKVDAIVISPVNPKASVTALERAAKAGIKVITYNSDLDKATVDKLGLKDFPASSITSDEVDLGRETGKAAAKFIKEKLGGKATIALIEFKSLLPDQSGARVKGFKDEISKLPGVKIVAEQDAWMSDKATDVVASILTGNPGINLVWAANEGGTVGATTAVKNANKAGKVYVFGTDMSQQIGDFLTAPDNILQAVTGQKPIDIGTKAIETAVAVLKGEKVEKQQTLPGVLFSRDDPAGIKQYIDSIKSVAK